MRFGQKKPGLQPLPPQLSDAWQARTVTFADWMFLRLRNASLARFSTRLGRANRDCADCLHTSHNVLQCFLTGFVDPGMFWTAPHWPAPRNRHFAAVSCGEISMLGFPGLAHTGYPMPITAFGGFFPVRASAQGSLCALRTFGPYHQQNFERGQRISGTTNTEVSETQISASNFALYLRRFTPCFISSIDNMKSC